jgi:hypothetical protein
MSQQLKIGDAPKPAAQVGAAKEDPAAPGHPAIDPMTGDISQCPFFSCKTPGDVKALLERATQILQNTSFKDQVMSQAANVLEEALADDPADVGGDAHRLLGQVYFQMERWADSARALEGCLKSRPTASNLEVATELLQKAKDRQATRVDIPGGPANLYDEAYLKQPPSTHLRVPEGIPSAPTPASPAGKKGIEAVLGKVVGRVGVVADDLSTDVIAFATKYAPVLSQLEEHLQKNTQANPSEAHRFAALFVAKVAVGFEKLSAKDKIWTNWDKDPETLALLKLAFQREWLTQNAIKSTYPEGNLVGYQSPNQSKPAYTDMVRTATGAYNTSDPMEGAAQTRFNSLGPKYETRVNRAVAPDLPSTREISRVVFTANGPRTEAPFLNMLAAGWIQFENHDWVDHPPDPVAGSYEIPLAADDPWRQEYGITQMSIPKTAPDPTQHDGKITSLNENTAWWDGSQIYGSDQQTVDRLRSDGAGNKLPFGKLRMEKGPNGDELPLNPQTGVEDTGFARNWWVGLDLFHTLFVKNHNFICDQLHKAHPDWTSDRLFETARMINAAIMAKIHTTEWTPAVLPNKTSTTALNTNWFGFEETKLKAFKDRRVLREGKPTDDILGGIVGNKWVDLGVPHNFAEEFPAVYRLHPTIPDAIQLRRVDGTSDGSIATEQTRGAGARQLARKEGIANLLSSFGYQKMGALVNNNYPKFMQDTSQPNVPVMDLGAIDLLRDRERGVLPYNEFRRKLGLNPIATFDDLTPDKALAQKLRDLYCKDANGKPIPEKEGVEKLDLLAGTLSEGTRPEYFGFGETLFQVFIAMASRRLLADPFYRDRFNPAVYSAEGVAMIEGANGYPGSLKDLLLMHFPELRKTGLMDVNNAFEPWGTNATTAPAEHPLTSLNSENYGLSDAKFLRVRDTQGTGKSYIVDMDSEIVLADNKNNGKIDVTEADKGSDAAAVLQAAREMFGNASAPPFPGASTADGRFQSGGILDKPEATDLRNGRSSTRTAAAPSTSRRITPVGAGSVSPSSARP